MGNTGRQEALYFVKVKDGLEFIIPTIIKSMVNRVGVSEAEATSAIEVAYKSDSLFVLYEGIVPIAAVSMAKNDDEKVIVFQLFVPIKGRVNSILCKLHNVIAQNYQDYKVGIWLPVRYYSSLNFNRYWKAVLVFATVAFDESERQNIVGRLNNTEIGGRDEAVGYERAEARQEVQSEVHEVQGNEQSEGEQSEIEKWMSMSDEEWLEVTDNEFAQNLQTDR